MSVVLGFADAMAMAKALSDTPPAILLGNGFSIAYDRQIFSYEALFESADWGSAPRAKEIFNKLGTTDFEYVIRTMESAARVIKVYDPEGSLAETIRYEADFLKSALIDAITRTHPETIFSVCSERMSRTVSFLKQFSKVFTLNYDLLLYWAIVTNGFEARSFRDGFREKDACLEWSDFKDQELLYLHGALHLFQQRDRIEKIRYQRNRLIQTLIEQIVHRIAEGHAPLFVCEGTNDQKLEQIGNSRYLRFCYRALQQLNTNLFLYGHSLGPADKHIMDAILRSDVRHLFVSLYGDPNGEHNQSIMRATDVIRAERRWGQVDVHFYNPATAGIW